MGATRVAVASGWRLVSKGLMLVLLHAHGSIGHSSAPSGVAVVVVRILDGHDGADRRGGEGIRWSCPEWEVGERLGSGLVVIDHFLGFTVNNALCGLVS